MQAFAIRHASSPAAISTQWQRWGTAAFDAIITNAAGCGSTLKEYDELFEHDPEYYEKAKQFKARMKDVTEFLASIELNKEMKPLSATVTYQDSCHLAHGQKIRSAPRQLLRAIPGLTFREMPLSDMCCGSAGIYNVLHTDLSLSILEEEDGKRQPGERGGYRDCQSGLHAATGGGSPQMGSRRARPARHRAARRSLPRILMRVPVALLALALAGPACAHDVSRSDSKIEVQGRVVSATLTLNVKELQNPLVPLQSFDLDRDIGPIFDAVRNHFLITTPAFPIETRLGSYSVLAGSLIRLQILYTFGQNVTALVVRSTLYEIMPAGHQHLLNVRLNGTLHEAILDARTPEKTFSGVRQLTCRLSGDFCGWASNTFSPDTTISRFCSGCWWRQRRLARW